MNSLMIYCRWDEDERNSSIPVCYIYAMKGAFVAANSFVRAE